MRRLAIVPLVLLAACVGPFRRPDLDPRPAKVPAGVGIFVKTVGGGCRTVLIGDRIHRSCRGRDRDHAPKDTTAGTR